MLSTSFFPDVHFCEFVEVLGLLFLGEGVGHNFAASELELTELLQRLVCCCLEFNAVFWVKVWYTLLIKS